MPDAFEEGWFDRLIAQEPAQREGLPAGYRMRHDAHDVDRLTQPAVPQVQLIPVGQIEAVAATGSRDDTPLVASVARFGLLQPLLVRRHNGRYHLIAGARRLAAAVAAGLDEVPCLVHDADDHRAKALREASNAHAAHEAAPVVRPAVASSAPAHALADITTRLEAIVSCLNLLGDHDRPLRERVAVALIETELQRATWLARGLQVLADEPVLARTAVDVPALLTRIVEAMHAEHSLSGVRVVTELREPRRVLADERLVSIAIAGGLIGIHAIAQCAPGAILLCRIAADAAHAVLVLEIGQRAVTLPGSRLARFFDIGWTDRPGGCAAGVGLLAARRIVELHGGKIGVSPADEGGCWLRLELPCEALA